ncbi:MAG TPA: YkgJ family cysteine cluster protein [Phormidium sp.]
MGNKNKKLRTLQEIYDKVPAIACKGLCSGGCTQIPSYPAEIQAIQQAGLTVPSYDETTGRCAALVEGRCTIYDHRPLICRLYGNVATKMQCQFGCKPAFYLTDRQAKRLLEAVSKFGTAGGGAVIPRTGGILLKEPHISLKRDVIEKILRKKDGK